MKVRMRTLAYQQAFMFEGDDTVYEYRGNGWYQIYGKTETGGPWHESEDRWVFTEDDVKHPSQTLSCFV